MAYRCASKIFFAIDVHKLIDRTGKVLVVTDETRDSYQVERDLSVEALARNWRVTVEEFDKLAWTFLPRPRPSGIARGANRESGGLLDAFRRVVRYVGPPLG